MVVEFVTPFRDRTLELLDDQAAPRRHPRAGRRAGRRGRRGHPARRLPAGRVRRRRPHGRRVGCHPCPPSASRSPSRSRGAAGCRTSASPTATTQGATIPTHITLVPPLEVAEDRLADVERAPGARSPPSAAAFRVHLRGTGTFRPVSPVVFVSLVEGISQTASSSPHACRRGPLALELALPVPPARHGRPPPRRRRCSTAPSRSSPDFDCASTVDRLPPLRPRRRPRVEGHRTTSPCWVPAPDAVAVAAGEGGALASPREVGPLVDHLSGCSSTTAR